MGTSRKSNAVLVPNLGVYTDRPSLALDTRMLENCRNVRIKNGEILRDNMGWSKFMTRNLVDPVTLIDQFFLSTGSQILIFGTTKNLYQFDESAEDVTYINRRYEVGSIAATSGSTAILGSATLWAANLAAGDEIFVGATSIVSVDQSWHEIAVISGDISLTLVSAYNSATAADVAYTARKIFTGDVKDAWSTDIFPNVVTSASGTEDQWFATNGVDNIIMWNGSDTQVTAMTTAVNPSLGFTCKDLVIHKEMLICFNVVEAGLNKATSMKYSDIGNPLDFSGGLSGESVVHDGVDAILIAIPLGDNLAVYSERTITLVQFVGTPTDFIFRIVISGIGALSARAVTDFGDSHEFLGPDAQYTFNGISIEEVGSQIWREILRIHNPNKLELFQSHVDEENGEVLWIVPLTTDPGDITTGQPTTAFVEHYLEEVGERRNVPYTIRDLTATATGYFDRADTLRFSDISDTWAEQNNRWNDRFFQAAFPFNLFGDELGNIFILGEADSQDGTDIASFATFGLRPVVDGIRKGIIKRVYPFAAQLPAASYDLAVNVLTTDQANGTTVSQASAGYDLTHSTSNNNFVSPFIAARYYQIKFSVEGTGRPFNLAGYDTEIVRAGKR